MIRYYKDNKLVERPKSLQVGLNCYIPPTDEQLIENGYEIVEEEPYKLSYKEQIQNLIHERYSIDDEIAILRQRDTKPDEFDEYNNYCEYCKQQVKELENL